MTVELFANPEVPGVSLPLAQLTEAISTTPASGTVESYGVSAAAPLALRGSSGQFRVLVDQEYMLVTAKVDGSSPWDFERGAEGSTPAPHAINAPIHHLVTAGALATKADLDSATGQLLDSQAPASAITDARGSAAGDLLLYDGGTFARLARGSSDQRLTVRSDGTVAWTRPLGISVRSWGADPSFTSSANRTAIQNAINAARGTGSLANGRVDYPSATYTVDGALLAYFAVRHVGEQGNGRTIIKADASQPLSNFQTGTQGTGANQPRFGMTVAVLSSALSTGGPITALAVKPLTMDIPSGMAVQIASGSHAQTWATTAPASVGDTSVAVASQTPDFAYPIGAALNVAVPAMLRWDGGDPWAHGVEVLNINFDTSNIPGLEATWFQSPGELSFFHNLKCDNTAAVSRAVTDGQISNASNVVTFTTSTVTENDVNALVTDRGDGDHTLDGPTIPAWTKIDRINYVDAYNDLTALSVTLSRPATAAATNSSFTIKRPSDAFTFDGAAARGRIGSLNGVKNSGALLRLKNFADATWSIDSLSGDDNLGGILRISRASHGADPASITIGQIKAEQDTYNIVYPASMDPVILLDRCGPVALNILGGSFIGGLGQGRDVIRLDQCNVVTGMGPSIELGGVEGANWFNPSYTNIIHDTVTGKVVPVSGASGNAYPKIFWGRDVFYGGGSVLHNATAQGLALTGAGGVLDTSAVSGAHTIANGGNLGDKIVLLGGTGGAASNGLGVQPGRVVVFLAAGAAFAVRPASATGAASSGTDAVVLWANGVIQGNVSWGAISVPPGTTTRTPTAHASQSTITVANSTPFTIAAPLNPPDSGYTQDLTIEVFNNTAGAMGAITWDPVFVFPASVGTWVNPNAGERKIARFEWNGANWICTSPVGVRQTGWVSKAADYTLKNTDSGAVVTATAIITLPANPDPSLRYGVKCFGQGITVTVSTGGANVIDSGGPTNATSVPITANGESLDFALAPNGTDWILV